MSIAEGGCSHLRPRRCALATLGVSPDVAFDVITAAEAAVRLYSVRRKGAVADGGDEVSDFKSMQRQASRIRSSRTRSSALGHRSHRGLASAPACP